MNESEIKALCTVVRNTSLAAHRFFRHGHAEKFYENSLRNRLIRSGLKVDQQVPLEVKAVNQLSSEHTAQVLGYLRAADLEHAMLINFGSPKIAFKKFIWNQ